jgi:parallel beta-helix repeat protein
MRAILPVLVLLGSLVYADGPFVRRSTWYQTLRATRPALRELAKPRSPEGKRVWDEFWQRLSREFPNATADGLSRTLPLPTPNAAAGIALHVATIGNDANPGTAERPFRTLERARNAIRGLPRTQPITVLIHGGTYYLERPLHLEPRDSGTPAAPITYRAAPGETVVLSGGRPVTDWHEGKEGVWYADIPEARDPNFGQTPRYHVVRYDDREHVRYTGSWVQGEDWRHDGNTGKDEKTAAFHVDVPRDGEYALYTSWRPFGNRARQIPVTVTHAGGTTDCIVDGTRFGGPHLLGRFRLTQRDGATVTFSNRGTEGYVAVQQVAWLPAAELPRQDAWRFHQLFVNGRRETLARYPNADPADIRRRGWLYVAKGNSVLAGLGQPGDWVEYRLTVPKTAVYSLWIGTATVFETPNRYLQVLLDGTAVPLDDLPCGDDWRQSAFGKAAQVRIPAGEHVLRVASIAPVTGDETQERRVHLDAFIFSDNPSFRIGPHRRLPPVADGETRIVLEAEDETARRDMESHFGPKVFPCIKGRGYPDRFPMVRSDYKPNWAGEPQTEVYMFATWGWFNTITRLDRFEDTGDADIWVHLTGREARTPVWDGNRYYLFNLRSELDTPGEWFLDYRTGRLSYRPQPGQRPDQSTIVAPRLTRLVELIAPSSGEERVEYVTFQGLELRHAALTRDHPAWRSTEDCAVLLENAWHCVVRDCRFTNLGGYAVRLSLDSCLNRVVGNQMSELGAGGVMLRGPWVGWGQNVLSPEPEATVLAPLGNLIDHNHIHHCGRIKKYVAGIHIETRPKALAYAPGNVYRHNHIHDMPRNGIFGFRNLGGYVIEQNHIHDVLAESDDGGLVHVCTAALNGTAPALIRQNLLYNAYAFRQDDVWKGRTGLDAAANGHGVYLDGWTSHVTVESNVIRNTRKGCVFIHDGQNNTIRNNVFLDDRKQQFWQTKSWNNRWERNVAVWTGETPLLASFRVTEDQDTPRPALIDHNLYWHGGQPLEIAGIGGFDAWRKTGFDAHSLLVDPEISDLDLANKQLRFAPDSPVHRIGFAVPDLSQVGVLPPEQRP